MSATLTFCGAAGTVTGSRHLLRAGRSRVLLDAGMFQGRKELRLRNWEPPGFEPSSVGHVLLSHTHIDHVGYLPRLVKLGLRAPVHCTPAAYELAELMLLDAAHLQEEDAEYANRKGFSKHRPALPLFDTRDARRALKLRRHEAYGDWFELSGGVRARFNNSGHLLGAAFVEIAVPRGDGSELRLVYSGDVGRFDVPLHLDPEPMPRCDVLVIESTYGDRDHPATPAADQVTEPLRRTLDRGGTVLIPAFAVGRSQQVTLILRRLMRAGRIPDVPIHLDSPMAIDATRIYSRHLDRGNVDADVFEDGRLRLFPDDVSFHRTTDESKALNRLGGPRILVSASGMLVGGRVLHHLKRLAPDPRNLILLAGYQAAGTRGRLLADGAKSIRVHGGDVEVKARVESFRGLSGHADREELLRWVESAGRPPRRCFVVHGEPDSSAAFARLLETRLATRAIVPRLDETFDLAG